jgi:carbon storage regulator CsrA
MLVITRGRNDKVVFPSLGISVEILRIAGNKVRIGIDAPPEISVLRHEVSDRLEAGGEGARQMPQVDSDAIRDNRFSHAIRNRLNAATLGLHFLHRKIEMGDLSDAEATIFRIFRELKTLEDEIQAEPGDRKTWECGFHRRALVVEDNDNERELLAGFLQLNGFDVETATDGLQAMVRLTQNGPPDVVLLDMRMPRFDGRRTVSAIRSNPACGHLKVFAVSGTSQEEMNVEIGPHGIDRWFSKPLNPKVLVEAIREDLPSDCLMR